MNREIKFRAWLPQYETMVDEKFDSNDALSVDDISFELSSSGVQVYVLELYDREVGGEHDQGYEFKLQKDASIMQYTGIKDKDGKEIYEGDILLFASKSESETFVREVKFEDGAFVVGVDDQCGMYLGGICTNENHEGSHTGFVMGNIYQNPKLLQES